MIQFLIFILGIVKVGCKMVALTKNNRESLDIQRIHGFFIIPTPQLQVVLK